ncbi:uncharacterized protein LOC127739119 [Mytilus californianus]|uniref:uncharacterized protein LOC127739119 n=1 Tax=Mytilus californianus TaxID=6549 RepID=UPI0022484285|nr:uncharacterized protein LOC127739119 [Mytilus californianus]
MCHSKTESLHFYKYLCQKIGSVEVVRARRLLYIYRDLKSGRLWPPFTQITSGSKGEGLHLKGSDLDVMYVNYAFVVYESEKDAVQDCSWIPPIVLVMDNEDTQPCFTHLQVYTDYENIPYFIKQMLQQHRGENLLSSQLFMLNNLGLSKGLTDPRINKIHGPCLSDSNDNIDNAYCLKCDQWVSLAQPWISRSRLIWPTPELISKITSCGVLFVPIGYKGSINENLQWRISFSVAEKVLIFSFNHTQLLCYALLKISLKEIVNRNEDLKGLLCSYFLKTLMFWILEETETSVWRPYNIIPCFMACLQKLLYCIEYSTLLHYFIPDNNLFYLRFNSKQRNTLINTLKNSYQIGIHIFLSSETLQDYRFPCEITKSVCDNTTLMKTILEYDFIPFEAVFINIPSMHKTLLYHCKTELSKCLLALSIANTYQRIPLALPHKNNPNNKQQYKNYKHDLSQLLVGLQSDAVSGWLKLASFFYVHKNYSTSIDIINYTLSKCTDDSAVPNITLKQRQKMKLISLLKTLPNPCVTFEKQSSVIPMELKFDVRKYPIFLKSTQCAHFLRFLCCYHLQDLKSCWYSKNQLFKTTHEYALKGELDVIGLVSLGVVLQMLGYRYRARILFYFATQLDETYRTSAAYRLQQLS